MVSTSVPRLVPKPRLKHAKGASRRAQYSASTKRALLDVAQDLFTEHGYAGTSLDAIVAGKQALFEEVFERVEHAASKAVHDQIKGEQDPWLKARAGLRAFLEVVRQPTYRRVVIQDGPGVLGYERFREQEERSTFSNVLTIVASVLSAGPLEMDEPMQRTFARIFFGAMSSAGESVSLAEDPEAASDRVEAAIGIILDGLQALTSAR